MAVKEMAVLPFRIERSTHLEQLQVTLALLGQLEGRHIEPPISLAQIGLKSIKS